MTKPKPKPVPVEPVEAEKPFPCSILSMGERPQSLMADHYLLQEVVHLWCKKQITSKELDVAYNDVNKAIELFYMTRREK